MRCRCRQIRRLSIVFGQVGEFNLTGMTTLLRTRFLFPLGWKADAVRNGLAIDETGGNSRRWRYWAQTRSVLFVPTAMTRSPAPGSSIYLAILTTADQISECFRVVGGRVRQSSIDRNSYAQSSATWPDDLLPSGAWLTKNAESFENGAGDQQPGKDAQPAFYLTLRTRRMRVRSRYPYRSHGIAVDAQGNLFVAITSIWVPEFPRPFEIG